jgi:hypothetical protein
MRLIERNPAREIAAIREERPKRLGRHCDHEVVDREHSDRPHAIEPDRQVVGCVPDQAREGWPAYSEQEDP